MTPPPGRSRKLRIIITAGPSREKFDPIRFLSNYSTGTIGYALAREAKYRNHAVILISGPTCLAAPRGVTTVMVESARQMRRAVFKNFRTADALIMAAAVCDWRPLHEAPRKIKRRLQGKVSGGVISIPFVENPDILKEAGMKKGRKIITGFALETNALLKNALKKLKEKRLDCVVANKCGKKRTAFGPGPTDVVIIDSERRRTTLRRVSKQVVAKAIIDKVEALC